MVGAATVRQGEYKLTLLLLPNHGIVGIIWSADEPNRLREFAIGRIDFFFPAVNFFSLLLSISFLYAVRSDRFYVAIFNSFRRSVRELFDSEICD